MWKILLVAGLAAPVMAGPRQAVAQEGSGVAVRAFRYYAAEGRRTVVQALVEVPYGILEARADRENGELRYGVAVQVSDARGERLLNAAWAGGGNAVLRDRGATKLEILDFSVSPGQYDLEVVVTDSVSGRRFETSTAIDAWSATPPASDLMLSPSMRLATGSDTVPVMGEMRRGSVLITPVTRLKLSPVRSKAYYLIEAYADAPDSGAMQVTVTDSTGTALVSTRPTPIRIQPGGVLLRGQVDLAGLPAGTYGLSVRLQFGGTEVARSEQFDMAGFAETMEKEEERIALLRQTDEGFFGAMSEDEIDEAHAPLLYLVSADSMRVWGTGLSLQAKRRWMTDFWSARDPTPGTAKNEARERFYEVIGYANREFAEAGRKSTPGWRSDRGRIYIRYGVPDDVFDQSRLSGPTAPYLVWKYTRGKELNFVFVDQTRIGAFRLVYSNDLKEPAVAGWEGTLGPQAVTDISNFLGKNLAGPKNF
jgi:GWxTD domain-containing protein